MLTTLTLLLLLVLLLLLLARSVGAETLHTRLVAVENGVHQHRRALGRLVAKRSAGFQKESNRIYPVNPKLHPYPRDVR